MISARQARRLSAEVYELKRKNGVRTHHCKTCWGISTTHLAIGISFFY